MKRAREPPSMRVKEGLPPEDHTPILDGVAFGSTLPPMTLGESSTAGSKLGKPESSQPWDFTLESAETSIPSQTARSAADQENLDAATQWRAEADARRDKWLEEHTEEFDAKRMRHEFMGWVEVEGDPDYFTIMLERLGIKRAKVVEVHSLDEMLKNHHCLKYGIIFLSQYYNDDQDGPEEEVPRDLWFSNQTVDNACATIAILNIVNNVSTLDIGDNLGSFRCFTETFSPVMKAEALANFHWCRNIHNAFAKRTDILIGNLALEQEAESKASKSRSAKKGKGKCTRRTSLSNVPNHYIAYVPFAGNLWKLDGLDRHPRKLGPLVGGEGWINTVRNDIQYRMANINDGTSEGYSVFAIIENRLPRLIEMLAHNVRQLRFVEWCLSMKRDYWGKSVATDPEDNTWLPGREPIRGPDERYNLTQEILDAENLQAESQQRYKIAQCSEEYLTWGRPDIVDHQLHLREMIVPLKRERDEQWKKYKDAMFDYAPVIHHWMKFLHENEALEPLIDWHLANEGGVERELGDLKLH